MNEVGFLVMDLRFREQPDLAHRFLNRYMEITGDYKGLQHAALLRGLPCAGARQKVEGLRAAQADLERKRIHGLDSLARTGSDIESGLYSAEPGRRTYRRLEALARAIAGAAGYPVIADATVLRRAQRDAMGHLALEMKLPFRILEFSEDEETMRMRIQEWRKQDSGASEADAAVLEHQLPTREPLGADERRAAVDCGIRRAPAQIAAELARARAQDPA
jgi:predicted kinase